MKILKIESGFTFIEILIGVSVILLLMAVMLPTYRQYSYRSQLSSASGNMYTDLRTLQNKALNGEVDKNGNRVWWVMKITYQTTPYQYFYEVAGCPRTVSFSTCKDTDHGYKRVDIAVPDTVSVGVNGTYSIYYSPLDGTAQFFKNLSDTAVPGTPEDAEGVLIRLSSADAGDDVKVIKVDKSGLITMTDILHLDYQVFPL